MTGFEVVPQSLRDMGKTFDDAAETWASMVSEVEKLTLDKLDLGLLGEAADFTGDYNDAVGTISDKLGDGKKVLEGTGDTLIEVAKWYEEQEAEYYEQFGYLEKEMD